MEEARFLDLKEAAKKAHEENSTVEYFASTEELTPSSSSAQAMISSHEAYSEYVSSFFDNNDMDYLYDDHLSFMDRYLEGKGLQTMNSEEKAKAIEILQDTHNLFPQLSSEEEILQSKMKMIIAYSPFVNFEHTIQGAEGFDYAEGGEPVIIHEDYDNIMKIYGIEKDKLLEWCHECVSEAAKHEDNDLKFFSKYSPGNPYYSTFAKENKLFFSFIEEIENNTANPTNVVFLAKLTIQQAMDLKEGGSITLKKDVMTGFFDNLNGGGSVLGIECEKDITLDFSTNNKNGVFDVFVDGEGPGYGVDEVYGLTSEAWTDEVKVTKKEVSIKTLLDEDENIDMVEGVAIKQ